MHDKVIRNMRRIGILSFVIFLTSFRIQSANVSVPDAPIHADTLHKQHGDSTSLLHHTTIKPTTDFDQRFSFIRNNPVNIWGQRGGILINDWLKVGVGGYFMNDTRINIKRQGFQGNVTKRYLKQSLLFGTGYVEPFLIRRTYWEISIPVEAGYGKASSSFYRTSNDVFIRSNSKDFIPAGAGLSFSFKLPALPNFKPLSWIGINLLAGYRYCLLQNVYKTDYDGAFWSISGAIFLDRISDDCKAWKRKKKMEHS
jgi:hypothetical protein